jgi:hypothetical protein
MARHQQEGLVPFVSKYSNLIICLRRTVRHQEDWLVFFFVSREDGSLLTGGDRPFLSEVYWSSILGEMAIVTSRPNLVLLICKNIQVIVNVLTDKQQMS